MGNVDCSVAKRTRKVNTDRTNWDVDAQANAKQVTDTLNEKVRDNHYSSVEWRNEAILHSAVFGVRAFDTIKRQANQKIIGSKKSFFKKAIKQELNNAIAVRIAKEKGNMTPAFREIIKANLGYDAKTGEYSESLGYIIDNLQGTSESNDNLIAWYREAYNEEINEKTGISFANEFFNNVFAHQKLSTIKFDRDDNFGEYSLAVALDVNDDSGIYDPENGDNPVDTDTTNDVAAFDHSGEHKDFTIGIDQDIKTYFNCLKKLKSSEKAGNKWQVDKDNLFGFVNTMDERSCSSVLYHSGDFVDDQTMVESIRRIARNYTGFEAFMQFADYLANYADFRYKVYNSFAKQVMRKIETVVEDKEGKPNIANKRSNAVTALAFEFRNSIKSTAISCINTEIEERYNVWKELASDVKSIIATNRNDENVLNVIGELTSLLQAYYPTIDRFGIANYLYNATDINDKIDVAKNLSVLSNILNNTIVAAKRTAVSYNSLQYDIATEKNKAKKQALYETEYVDNANNQEAQALAETLAPYSVVRIDLNSRNTEGKLSSDVLNNNYLTGFINMLQSSLNRKIKSDDGSIRFAENCPLQKYKDFKFKTTQFNLSNILVEQTENGQVINRGLFRKVGDNYEPTEYATNLLRISKFNGATSFDNGKNTLYSKMSKNDYITTAVINYYKAEGGINGTPMANYFMRIPSDSSTQYVITAPRYPIQQSGTNALRTPDGKINKDHPLFKQFKNAFLQELIDMGDALNTIFITDEEGMVLRIPKGGKNVLQFKPGFQNKPTSKLYEKYHYNKEVVANFGTEKEELTGNVFKSNRFTLVKEDGTEVNYGQEFIANYVDFLYGGAVATDSKEIVHFIKENGRVSGINLEAQSQDFRNALDDMISRFITDYSIEAINRVSQSKSYIKDSLSSLMKDDKNDKEFNRKISEFALNTHLMYMNFDDLFEGNSKFYGSAQDFLKRAKEVQGSGTPYGIVNYNKDFIIKGKKDINGALLNDKRIIDRIGNIGQKDSFTAVTVVNTVRTPQETKDNGVITKALAQNFAKQAGRKNPNEADKERAKRMMKGFADAKVNDAQSYITFEEWVRRIAARGQLMKHLPLIEKVAKKQPLTDLDMDALIQVQKNFYYDQYYDKDTGIIVPRQIKNAEFVLVPQFIEGTQLEQVYNLMKKHKIDQLNTKETSKAGKHNILTLWDDNGNLTEENLKDFDARAGEAVEYFNYNYLYTQQETPQHVNAENKTGIQIMKKIIDNIPPGHKLYKIKERFMQLYSANIQSAFNDLVSELNIETDENGYPIVDEETGQIKGLDYQKLWDMFREEAERLGTDSNLSDYFTLDEEIIKGIRQPIMPSFFGNNSNRVEAVAQALFNSRITRQTLPGFHGAQVTQIGFKKENIQKDDALRYHSKINPKTGEEEYADYIEVKLPKANFGLSQYDDKTALTMLQEAGLDELIGYRIPTEGKQSVSVMKVVGFTNDAQGSTIIVPDGWVPQTGSDFDVDSIYGIQFHSYFDKDGNLQRVKYNNDVRELYKNYVLKALDEDEIKALRNSSTTTAEDVEKGLTPEIINSTFMLELENYAKKHNLDSFEEFKQRDLDFINSKEARDNELLECMMTILRDESSMEELFGRSNFDDISNEDKNNLGAIQKMMNPAERSRREKRSPYNFFDQADYQDDAMSGAKLKGFSVTRDNLCSVCNTVRPMVTTNAYTMLYDAKKYNIAGIIAAFGKQNVELTEDGKYIKVRHKTFGWTVTNKNIVGRLLTSYSSQTTAHILDAIKEGAAPNVNDFTFAVYKTFVDVGSDYDTAIGFMAQPAVSRIVDNYNKNKSIFTSYNTNPLQQAIRNVAEAIGINTKDRGNKNISLNKIVEQLNKNSKIATVFKNIFGVDFEIKNIKGNNIDFEDFALPTYLLKDRIDEAGIFASSPVERNAFDLGILLKYSQFATFSQRIGDCARVLNPDKFGAKKNIFETNKVFEDIQELISKDDMPLIVNMGNGVSESILEAIYPGIGNGTIGGFMRAKPERESKYKPLYSFLKYATAPSIVINRTLFDTQSREFVTAVKKLETALTFDSRLTEKQYTDYQKYLLGELYSEIPFIKGSIIYNQKTDRFDIELPSKNDTQEEIYRKSKEGEFTRIYGFNSASDINFKPQRLYSPTKADIATWRTFSPAQKVLWIQQNAKNPGIFGLFRVDLRNSNRDNAQTIEFDEDAVSIENAYSMFVNAYYSENPLIKYAAADLIKYAFVVEGFNMSQHAINKIIRNTPLIQSIDTGGTGIVSWMKAAVGNVHSYVNPDTTIERYVRSHDIQGIARIKLSDLHTTKLLDENNFYNIIEVINGEIVERKVPSETGVYIIQLSEDNISILKENNMAQETEYGLELVPYFKTPGKKGVTYKLINYDSNTAYAFPLNKLQPNEHTNWSARIANNKYPSSTYYSGICYGEIDTTRRQEFMSPIKARYNEVVDFDITELKDNTVNKIKSVADELAKDNVYFLWSPELSTKLENFREMTVQEIDGVVYDIIKTPNTKVQKKYLGENSNVAIQTRDIAYNDLINNPKYGLRAMGFKKPSMDVYMVKRHKRVEVEVSSEELNSDTVESLGALSIEAILNNSKQGDKVAKEAATMLNSRNIDSAFATPNTEDGLFIISNYLTRVVDKINDQLKHFTMDDGQQYPVNDPKVINYIRNNPAERRRYLKLLLDARKIKHQFEKFNAFDTTSTDPTLKRYLDNIKDKVVKLDEALVSSGLELFSKDYLKGISTNPLIQKEIINLYDTTFYGSGWLEAMINDTQEMPNPLIQIITKEVMADIRAKESAAEETIKEFDDTINKIKKEAAAAGMSVNMDNIVDETGTLVQPYNKDFIDDYRDLKANIDYIRSHRIDDGTPEGTIDYKALNRAQLALDKWLRDNVELPLKGDEKDEFGIEQKSFYTRKIELDQMMIDKAEDTFAKYNELKARRDNIASRVDNINPDPRQQEKLKAINIELKSLSASTIYDPVNNTFTPKTGKDKEEAELLSKYKKEIKNLYDTYYDREENAGFREDLEENLRVIKEAERRDAFGVPKASKDELAHNDRYQRAITWITKNAIFTPDPEVHKQINEAFKVLRSGSKQTSVSTSIKAIATHFDIYDILGNIDGTKLTAEQQQNVAEAQQKDYNKQDNSDATAVTLINSAGENNEVYTKEFYKLLYRGGYANSSEYTAKVKEINNILSQHYGNSKTINWVTMSNDELKDLANFYRELREIKEDIEFTWKSNYAKLHSEVIEYQINQENFDIARNAAEQSGIDMNLWDMVNTESIIENGTKVRVPNRLIYGKPVPTAEARTKVNRKNGKLIYIDKAKTEALQTIRGYMISEPSEHYNQEFARRRAEGVDADGRTFEQWYNDNHVYNPYTRTMIPTRIWMTSRINDNGKGTWEASYNQSHTVAKQGFENPNHKDGISLGVNYKDNNGKYKNNIKQNKYEQEVQTYLSNLLISLAKVDTAKRFFESGRMPIMSKEEEHDYRFYLKEAAKGVGWIEDRRTGKGFDRDVDYNNDKILDMPMTRMLRERVKDKVELTPPGAPESYNSIEDYNKAVDDYTKATLKQKAEEEKYHQAHLNRDWVNVVKQFIKEAAHYNAVEDNKPLIYYGQEILKHQKVFDTNMGRKSLIKVDSSSTGRNVAYQTRNTIDREYKQYTNWTRRLIRNQWKEDNGRLTRLGNLLQSFTSANFMMMNVRGGIANVTLGETQILAEAWAKEYFGTSEYTKGKSIWFQSVPSFLLKMYDEDSTTVADALVKFMNVVDFDEVSGVVHADLDPAAYLKRVRDFMFSPQTMGEHFMQNSAMFSIMLSHRLYENKDTKLNGKTAYVVKGRAEVIRDAHEAALDKILKNEPALKQKFEEFKASELSDDDVRKNYAWFRRDMTTEFVRRLDNDKKKEFIKLREKYEKKALDDFNNHPDIMSQFTLGKDGKLAFANGSILAQLNNSEEANSEVNDAYKIIGALKGRIISVNKKIHGVYDRMGSAQIEKYWWGGVAMQYHKHIYPGFMKRYRRQGYYNEERGTVEKGSYVALKDFLSIPIDEFRADMKDNEVSGMKAVQNLFKHITDFCLNISTHWHLLPDYERANIRRNWGDIVGVLTALAFAIGLRALGDDDDDDNLVTNLMLYEADRLASESAQFNPFGAWVEAKKLWSNPLAAQSLVNDALASMNTMAQILIEGDDYDPYYHSGKYAGKHKLSVYVTRRIPIWRGINALLNVADDNHYYKLGDNMLSIVPVKDMGHWINKQFK